MLVLHDPATLLRDTVELLGSRLIKAQECPERITAILEALKTSAKHEVRQVLQNASDGAHLKHAIAVSHDKGYLHHLESAHAGWVAQDLITQDESILPECFRVPTAMTTKKDSKPPKDIFARAGYYAWDMSTGISKGSWTSILASANLAVEAVDILLPKESTQQSDPKSVLALCRPPGHHCNGFMAGGYCYLNNIVVAIDSLRLRLGPKKAAQTKIAILDIDFHHGNGTQDAFYRDGGVLYLSVHGEDEFPYYSGYEDELGEGEGYGFNCNFPLKAGASFEEYIGKLSAALGELASFAPDYVFVSLGFDTFHLDPLGKFSIETEHYGQIARQIRSSKGVKGVPCAILLEGGYVIDRLGANMLSFLEGWEDAEKMEAAT